VKWALEVAVDDGVSFVLGDTGQRVQRYSPRQERERVDRAELVDGTRNESAPTGARGYVGVVEYGAQLLGQRPASVDVTSLTMMLAPSAAKSRETWAPRLPAPLVTIDNPASSSPMARKASRTATEGQLGRYIAGA
jgi:hypothetical protein